MAMAAALRLMRGNRGPRRRRRRLVRKRAVTIVMAAVALAACRQGHGPSAPTTNSMSSSSATVPSTTTGRIVGSTTAVPMAARGTAVTLSRFAVRITPPPGWYVSANTYGFVGTMWIELGWLSTEPGLVDACRRVDNSGGVTEGCWLSLTSLPTGGMVATVIQQNADMQVRPDELGAAVDRNGRRVLYRTSAPRCSLDATALGTAVIFRTDPVVVEIDLCGNGVPSDVGRQILDALVDGVAFTA